MKHKNTIAFDCRPSSLPQSNAPHFRIRSSSKDKFLSTMCKSKEKSFFQPDEDKHPDNQFSERMKLSHKQLRKILSNRRHQRQRSQDMDNVDRRFLETLDMRKQQRNQTQGEQHNPNPAESVKRKIMYEDVKTEESQLIRKTWVDINSIDTAEDIKILDRITNMCDPFRIIKECDSRARLERKSEEQRVKSISVKKSKLTDKINTLVFQMASKSKSKNGFKIHRNKFEPINPLPSKQTVEGRHESQKQSSPRQKKQQISNPSPKHQNTPKAVPKQLQISAQLKQKAPLVQQQIQDIQNGVQIKPKYKMKMHERMKENNKKEMMDKFWSGINESLILAAQEEYVSKDLNELLYNNMT